MDICKEHRRILLNLANVKAVARVRAARVDTGSERTRKTADACPQALAIAYRVREGNSARLIALE